MGKRVAVRRAGPRLTLVGTIHVDPASPSLVRETIHIAKPEVVALELDPTRLDALQNLNGAKPNLSAGPSFLAMTLLEKFAGQLTGSSPGLEMLEAVKAARSVGARVELIDRPIGETIAGLKKLPLMEKVRIGFDGLASIVFLPFGKNDFSKLTDGIEDQLSLFRAHYPNLSKLLLDDREQYMSDRIKGVLDQTVGQVVAIVGFGHLASLAKLLEGYRQDRIYKTGVTWTLTTNWSSRSGLPDS